MLLGQWDAYNNIPFIADGVGTAGDSYLVIVAGTQNTGSGFFTYAVNDEISLNGSLQWRKVPTAAGGSGMTNPMTTTGDIIYAHDNFGDPARLGIGANGQVLEVVGGLPSWHNLPTIGTVTINGDPTAAQTLTTGTSGTDFAIVDNGTGDHKFNLPVASGTNTGKLSNTDWTTFNNKVTSISGVTNRTTISGTTTVPIVDIAATYVGQTSITTLGTITTGTWNGTAIDLTAYVTGVLPIANGGTGVSSVTTSPTATAWVGWDSHKNIRANNFIYGYQSIATTGGTTTFSVSTPRYTQFSGSSAQTVFLPVTSTLVVGQQFEIDNDSSGSLFIQASDGSSVQIMVFGSHATFTCESTSITDASAWDIAYHFINSITSSNASITENTTGYGVVDLVVSSSYSGGTGITTLGTITTGTWHGGVIPILYGGTAVTSVTTSPTATSWAGWDANKNFSAEGFVPAYATTATGGTTTTLSVGSAQQQYFTGSTTQTIVLPVTSTLVTGQYFEIVNNSSGNLTVNSSGGNLVQTVTSGYTCIVTCIGTTHTTAVDWSVFHTPSLSPGGTVTSITAGTGLSGGTITTSGTIALSTVTASLGGTGLTSLTAHNLLVGNGTGTVNFVDPGATANKVLLSNGTDFVLSTPTFPNASATLNKIIKSDGTNWVASTATYASPGTSGNLFVSDGTNWTASANPIVNNAITATANAATVPVTYRLSTVTNNSAATLTITMTTSGASDGQLTMVRVYDFSAVAQTIAWVNTENSVVTVPTTSNGSTTLPVTVGFMYNSQTSKWRCIASA